MSGMDRALEAFLIRLDPILLNPLTTNSNQRALVTNYGRQVG